jgi:hypothetical protein
MHTGKWFGACNDLKAAMDSCFREEKEEKRIANLKLARAFDESFEARERAKSTATIDAKK